MDVKEKLVELIQRAVGGCARHWASLIADHMIANGVTVQDPKVVEIDQVNKWIPASEPQKPIQEKVTGCGVKIGNAFWGRGTTVYKCPKCGNFVSRLYDYCYKCGQPFDWDKKPLPEPPKEVQDGSLE